MCRSTKVASPSRLLRGGGLELIKTTTTTKEISLCSFFKKKATSQNLPTCTPNVKDGDDSTARTEPEKFVSFAEDLKVQDHVSLRAMSDMEVQATWYSNEEYCQISTQCYNQIVKLDRGLQLKDKKYCARGLGGHTKMGRMTKVANRSASIAAVLDEQEIQFNAAVHDDEVISRAYRNAASSCQIWANAVALKDQREAEDFMETDDSMM